jgi:hypothetical protein
VVGLHIYTTEISSYMICQSYWKMYHWQLHHECGTCMLVLRSMRDVLSKRCHGRWIGRGGPIAWPPRSPDLNLLDFYLWGHLNTLVYTAPVDNEDNSVGSVNVCQTIHICPGILNGCDGPWRDLSRHALNLMEDILSTYKYTL